jgi:valyl-tRNA synthetase
VAKKEELPVNPLIDKPSVVCKCGCSEVVPEYDVMDTWATSSLSPQICCDLYTNKELDDSMIPMGLRPNAHDNVRVWDFYTVVKSLYHFNKLPWNDLMISGFVTSGDGEKLAKSKNNAALTPQNIITKYSADVTRYWAGGLSLGKDTCFSFDAFESGKKLQNKLWNASRFVLTFLEDYSLQRVDLYPMDKWILAKFIRLQNNFIRCLEKYEIAFALHELEKFFWDFCDNYIEIVKDRLYKP